MAKSVFSLVIHLKFNFDVTPIFVAVEIPYLWSCQHHLQLVLVVLQWEIPKPCIFMDSIERRLLKHLHFMKITLTVPKNSNLTTLLSLTCHSWSGLSTLWSFDSDFVAYNFYSRYWENLSFQNCHKIRAKNEPWFVAISLVFAW